MGYAERGYEIITDILEVTLKAIEGCSCIEGCPSCIQSPKCGNHNDPLDKHAALMILHELLGKPPYMPQKRKAQKNPAPQEKSDKPVSIGAALDRVRNTLRRDALETKAREPAVRGGSQKGKKQKSVERRKNTKKFLSE